MTDPSALLSLPAKRLQREIKRVARHIHKSTSLDELDRAWATLCRLQDALALAMESGRSLGDYTTSDLQGKRASEQQSRPTR